MKVLVTGATGFIGSAFVRAALARGHSVGMLASAERVVSAELSDATVLRGTLQDPPLREIEAFAAEVCVHSAWVTTPGVYLDSPENITFLDSSLSFLSQVQERGTNHIVGLGTCIEYEPSSERLAETSPIAPATLYARCKNDLRLALEQWAEASDGRLTVAWGRVFYPYGPHEHPSRLCSALIHKLRNDEPIVLRTPNSTKDYIYVDDLATAILTVVESRSSGPINLGTGDGISVLDLADTLARLLGKPELVQVEDPPQVDPIGDVVADASKLRGMGWAPRWSLPNGLGELLSS